MSKILLVNPPFYRLLGSHYNANSLGIAYIASYLNQNGHDAWLYNADYLNENKYENCKKLFGNFNNYLSYFNEVDHPIWKETSEAIAKFDPDWVGYTSYTANINAINIISSKVAQLLPKVKQVIGGVHATLDPNVLDSVPAIDFAVRREGENSMLRLVNGENPARIQGVVWRKNPLALITNVLEDSPVIENIDQMPFPERDKFWNIENKEKESIDVSYICSVRGCPYRCNYCASPNHWKRNKTRYRSPESVLQEMRILKSNYWNKKKYDYSASANTDTKQNLIIPDNTVVYFVDDIFTIKKQRAIDIMNGIIQEKLDMPWKCEVRADHLDEEICQKMKESNCVRAKIGFESGSDRILKQIQKDETTAEMLHGAKLLKKAGVPFTAYFMAGFPGETDEDLKKTISFAKEIDADYYSLSVLSPYYGTKMYFDLVSEGFELNKKPWEYFYHQTGELIANTTITPKILEEYLALNDYQKKYKNYI